jgi:hypothetical protein
VSFDGEKEESQIDAGFHKGKDLLWQFCLSLDDDMGGTPRKGAWTTRITHVTPAIWRTAMQGF